MSNGCSVHDKAEVRSHHQHWVSSVSSNVKMSAYDLPRSVNGNLALPWTGVYGSSKAALHLLTQCLQNELEGFGIRVMLVAPGAIKSSFGEKQANSLDMKSGLSVLQHSEHLLNILIDSLYNNVRKFIEMRAGISQSEFILYS